MTSASMRREYRVCISLRPRAISLGSIRNFRCSYRGTEIPPGPSMMYARKRIATITLPISNILFRSTATSLKPNRKFCARQQHPSGKCAQPPLKQPHSAQPPYPISRYPSPTGAPAGQGRTQLARAERGSLDGPPQAPVTIAPQRAQAMRDAARGRRAYRGGNLCISWALSSQSSRPQRSPSPTPRAGAVSSPARPRKGWCSACRWVLHASSRSRFVTGAHPALRPLEHLRHRVSFSGWRHPFRHRPVLATSERAKRPA